jgi:hypothetical protein
MKKIFALIVLMLLCVSSYGGFVQITTTNSIGQADTNAFWLTPISTPVLADGTWVGTGLRIRVTPNSSGIVITNLAPGNWCASNQFIVNQWSGNIGTSKGILFNVTPYSDTNIYPVNQLLISGGNTFNYSYGVRQITGTNGVSVTQSGTSVLIGLSGSSGVSSLTAGSNVTINANGGGAFTINADVGNSVLSNSVYAASNSLAGQIRGSTNGFTSIATSNAASFYLSSNPSGFVTSAVTNGLASTAYVQAQTNANWNNLLTQLNAASNSIITQAKGYTNNLVTTTTLNSASNSLLSSILAGDTASTNYAKNATNTLMSGTVVPLVNSASNSLLTSMASANTVVSNGLMSQLSSRAAGLTNTIIAATNVLDTTLRVLLTNSLVVTSNGLVTSYTAAINSASNSLQSQITSGGGVSLAQLLSTSNALLTTSSAYTTAVSNNVVTSSNALYGFGLTWSQNGTNNTTGATNTLFTGSVVPLVNSASNALRTQYTAATNDLRMAITNLVGVTSNALQSQITPLTAAAGTYVTTNDTRSLNLRGAGNLYSGTLSNSTWLVGPSGTGLTITNTASATGDGSITFFSAGLMLYKGSSTFLGDITATSFSGSGAGLTAIPLGSQNGRANLTSSTVGLSVTGGNNAVIGSGTSLTITNLPQTQVSNLVSDLAGKVSTTGYVPNMTNANILYVSTNGNDFTAITGVFERPWKTPSVAISNAVAGQTVLVSPGRYPDDYIVSVPAGVSVRGHGKGITTLGSGSQYILYMNDNNVFSDFSVSGQFAILPTGLGGRITSTNVAVRNCEARDNQVGVEAYLFDNNGTNLLNLTFDSCEFLLNGANDFAATLHYGFPGSTNSSYATNSTIVFRGCNTLATGGGGAMTPAFSATVSSTPYVTWERCSFTFTNSPLIAFEVGDGRMTFTGCNFTGNSLPSGTGIASDYALISQNSEVAAPGFSHYFSCSERYWISAEGRYIEDWSNQGNSFFYNFGIFGNGYGLTNLNGGSISNASVTSAAMAPSLTIQTNLEVDNNFFVRSNNVFAVTTNIVVISGAGTAAANGSYEWDTTQYTNKYELSGAYTLVYNNPVWQVVQNGSTILYTRTNASPAGGSWVTSSGANPAPTSWFGVYFNRSGVVDLGFQRSTNLNSLLSQYYVTLTTGTNAQISISQTATGKVAVISGTVGLDTITNVAMLKATNSPSADQMVPVSTGTNIAWQSIATTITNTFVQMTGGFSTNQYLQNPTVGGTLAGAVTSIGTNTAAYFPVLTNDFALGTRYTNTAAGGFSQQRAWVSASFQLTSAASGTPKVTMYVEHPGVRTNRLSVGTGALASLVITSPLGMPVPPGGVWRFVDETGGTGASVAIVTLTSSYLGE